MKKYFNKSIFKDKSFIKMICFTIVLLLVLILGNTFGYVSADGTYSLDLGIEDADFFLNTEDWRESEVYDSSVSVGYDLSTNRDANEIINPTVVSNYDNLVNYGVTGFPSVDGYGNPIDYSTFDAYLIYNNYLMLYDSSTTKVFYVNYSNANRLYAYASDRGAYIVQFGLTYGNPCTVTGGYYQEVYDERHASYFHSKNWIQLSAYTGYKLSNAPIYVSNQSYSDANSLIDGLFTGSDGVDSNYLLYDGGITPSEGSGISGGGSSTDYDGIGSNMYADYADFYLNNYTGNIYHNFRDVSVCFTSNLNDYIKNYLEIDETDLDEYSIWLDYTAYVDFYYQTVVDYGNVGVDLSAQFANVTLGADYNHDLIFTNDYHWACNYVFEPSESDSPFIDTGYLLGADSFVNDNNSIFTLPFSGLFAYLSPQGGYMSTNSSSNGTRYNTSITLYQLMDLIDENGIIWSSNYEGLNQFKLTCSAKIIYDDGTEMASSGNYIETFNLIDGTSTVDSDSMLTNYNPSITNTDTAVSVPSNTSSGTSSSSASTGNISQTVTVSNEGSKYIPSLISNLIPTSLGDTGTGLVSTFSTMASTNGFISVMASTVPAIPSTVWTYLTNYLGITLYLLACAFVLRLILDLL